MRIAILGGAAGPALLSLTVIVSAVLRPDYSHVRDFISELGATGTRYAAVMNYAGFVPAGLMLATFGVALAITWRRDRLALAAFVLATLFGLGIAACGLFSCDPGCPQTTGSVENLLHNRIAPISFFCLIVGTGILGFRFRRLPAWRDLAPYSLITSALGMCLLVGLARSLESRAFTGLWQRLLLAVLFLWCTVIARRALRHST